ncbi:MAG: hypothetical protein P8N48_00875 [Bacteroidales bacterium]|jgi:hypothetical protein|nr:dialkylrecorsinol condensing enzyme DarA [Lentimicrobiaceae bacterium]MDG1135438.1 hypothetical protein [Bacteroidales bacterium]MDG1902223.1 hypothetical protein [Bacteroidales bacterium]MDG2080185.1 hypothetical protein [Bacteroidales bacterium]|tara:strand:- start:20396 stop:21316 length:921 start_codon:yes stop_codon:yes gene_type:complete
MKHVLSITYSQSGQLNDIVTNITDNLSKNIKVHHHKITPVPNFPFPWTGKSFWNAMPESVQMIPSEIVPLNIDEQIDYDLIIIGYPIWFLSPAIPITTFFLGNQAKSILSNKPVLTVIGARNMWVMAQEEIKKMISECNGKLVGNIALCDKHYNLISVVTIIYWMMSGNKNNFLGIFPKPGISDEDISNVSVFSPVISNSVTNSDYDTLNEKLVNLKSARLIPDIVSIEEKGKRMFKIWSKFILKKGGPESNKRSFRLKIFSRYLLFVIFVVSPIASLIYYLTWPLLFIRIRRKLKYYKGVRLKAY